MLKNDLSFIAAAAATKELLYMSFHDKKTEKNDETHSVFGGFKNGKGGIIKNNIQDWDTKAMCMVKQPSERMIATSEDGEVLTYANGESTQEKIPDVKVSVLNLGVIDGYAYACGVWRQVFKRVGEGRWEPMHAPEPSKQEKYDAFIVFNSIAGYSAKDIYVVGSLGQIWHYNGKKWRQIDSPVRCSLNAVICGEDGYVYACGDYGVILRGRDDKWTVIAEKGTGSNYWDAHWFNDRLYMATMGGLKEYTEKEGVKLVTFEGADDYPDSCYHLTAAEGVMWSIGSEDIFSFDGTKWTRIE